MERAHPRHPFDRVAQVAAHAQFHLARGLVGEGHGQNLRRKGAARVQQMRDARGQGLGLARARACKHQDWAIKRFDRFALRGGSTHPDTGLRRAAMARADKGKSVLKSDMGEA